MKSFLLFLFILPTICFASGKLTVQPSYWLGAKRVTPMVGVGIYEKLIPGLYYNGWTGAGMQPRESGNLLWLSSKHDLETYIGGNLSVAVGYTFRKAQKPSLAYPDESDVHCKVTLKLW